MENILKYMKEHNLNEVFWDGFTNHIQYLEGHEKVPRKDSCFLQGYCSALMWADLITWKEKEKFVTLIIDNTDYSK